MCRQRRGSTKHERIAERNLMILQHARLKRRGRSLQVGHLHPLQTCFECKLPNLSLNWRRIGTLHPKFFPRPSYAFDQAGYSSSG